MAKRKRRWGRKRLVSGRLSTAPPATQTVPRLNAFFDPAYLFTPSSFVGLEREYGPREPTPAQAAENLWLEWTWAEGNEDGVPSLRVRRCVSCGQVWDTERVDELDDLADHLESKLAPDVLVAALRARADAGRDTPEEARRRDVHANPLARRQTERLVPGQTRAERVVQEPQYFGLSFGPDLPERVGEERSSAVAREAVVAADPTSILDAPTPFEAFVMEELSASYTRLVDKHMARLFLGSGGLPQGIVGSQMSVQRVPDPDPDPNVIQWSVSWPGLLTAVKETSDQVDALNYALGGSRAERRSRAEPDVVRRRHGSGAVCPRHGATRGGTCLKCLTVS